MIFQLWQRKVTQKNFLYSDYLNVYILSILFLSRDYFNKITEKFKNQVDIKGCSSMLEGIGKNVCVCVGGGIQPNLNT